jgi:hypothetical protein
MQRQRRRYKALQSSGSALFLAPSAIRLPAAAFSAGGVAPGERSHLYSSCTSCVRSAQQAWPRPSTAATQRSLSSGPLSGVSSSLRLAGSDSLLFRSCNSTRGDSGDGDDGVTTPVATPLRLQKRQGRRRRRCRFSNNTCTSASEHQHVADTFALHTSRSQRRRRRRTSCSYSRLVNSDKDSAQAAAASTRVPRFQLSLSEDSRTTTSQRQPPPPLLIVNVGISNSAVRLGSKSGASDFSAAVQAAPAPRLHCSIGIRHPALAATF